MSRHADSPRSTIPPVMPAAAACCPIAVASGTTALVAALVLVFAPIPMEVRLAIATILVTPVGLTIIPFSIKWGHDRDRAASRSGAIEIDAGQAFTIDEDTALNRNVLDNDDDADFDPLTAELIFVLILVDDFEHGIAARARHAFVESGFLGSDPKPLPTDGACYAWHISSVLNL